MTANHIFSAFSFISFVLVSIPFARQLKARNTATCIYIFWVSLCTSVLFVNSLIWDGNVIDWSPIWCDISGRIILAMNVGISAACLCIQRRLHHFVLNPSVVTDLKADERRFIIVDMVIGVGIPVLHLILVYVVQMQRYDIFGDFGCRIPIINTSLGVVLVPMCRLVLSLVSAGYGCVNFYRVWIKRRAIASTLDSSTTALKNSHFLRLFILCEFDIITIPLYIWGLLQWFPVYSWKSWASIHKDFGRIDMFPAEMWQANRSMRFSIELNRWSAVVYAFIFFILIGFTDEARKGYRSTLRSVAKKVGCQNLFSGSSNTNSMLADDAAGPKPLLIDAVGI